MTGVRIPDDAVRAVRGIAQNLPALPSPEDRVAIRVAAGFSQTALANAIGCHRLTLNRWEKDQSTLRDKSRFTYIAVLDALSRLIEDQENVAASRHQPDIASGRDPLATDWGARLARQMREPSGRAHIRAGYAEAGIYLLRPCPRCGVPEGHRCVGPSGGDVAWHRARTEAAVHVFDAFRAVARGTSQMPAP